MIARFPRPHQRTAHLPLSDREASVVEELARRRDEIVELATTLIGFDTTAREVGEPARQETELQQHLATRLRERGAEIDLFEPDASAMAGRPLVPKGLDFAGRPQLIARFGGTGGGRSLIFNGHIDAVSFEPYDRWTSDPLAAEVRDGLLFGRGSCDMKGGVAAMTVAAETLAELGIRLQGDLTVATNTDEESSGAGGIALVDRGLRADAGIVTEATGGDVWVACRGSEYGAITIPGQTGHAEVAHGHWREGGAVNAIEKATIVIDAIRRLREDWRLQRRFEHPYLAKPDVVATKIQAGEWAVTYPADCRITVACLYLPVQRDGSGSGGDVKREVEEWIVRAAAADPWLAEHPPSVHWYDNGVMPLEIPADHPIVAITAAASDDVGRGGKLWGLDSWYDGATLTLFADTPAIAYGPAGFSSDGAKIAHTIDEHVPVDDLVKTAQALAIAAMRFCGA